MWYFVKQKKSSCITLFSSITVIVPSCVFARKHIFRHAKLRRIDRDAEIEFAAAYGCCLFA